MMRYFFYLFMTLSILANIAQSAVVIPGYIGRQSFELSEEDAQWVTAIQKINKEGSQVAISDGRMDGADLVGKVPSVPVGYTGPNYKPKINHEKDFMEKAFADGYNFNYHRYLLFEFQMNQ